MKRRFFLQWLGLLPLTRGVVAEMGETPPHTLLQVSPLAGFPYYDAEHVWSRLKVGQPLVLFAEPGNDYDSHAVEILWQGHKLGYLPRRENDLASRLLLEGREVHAKITSLEDSDDIWDRLFLKVYMEGPRISLL